MTWSKCWILFMPARNPPGASCRELAKIVPQRQRGLIIRRVREDQLVILNCAVGSHGNHRHRALPWRVRRARVPQPDCGAGDRTVGAGWPDSTCKRPHNSVSGRGSCPPEFIGHTDILGGDPRSPTRRHPKDPLECRTLHGFLDVALKQPPVDRVAGGETQPHGELHHEPEHRVRLWNLTSKNEEGGDRHPAIHANLPRR